MHCGLFLSLFLAARSMARAIVGCLGFAFYPSTSTSAPPHPWFYSDVNVSIRWLVPWGPSKWLTTMSDIEPRGTNTRLCDVDVRVVGKCDKILLHFSLPRSRSISKHLSKLKLLRIACIPWGIKKHQTGACGYRHVPCGHRQHRPWTGFETQSIKHR